MRLILLYDKILKGDFILESRKILSGIVSALLLVGVALPVSASTWPTTPIEGWRYSKKTAKTIYLIRPALRGATTKYNAKNKVLTIDGRSQKIAKVSINYNGRHLKSVKVDKHGNYKANVKFKGYGKLTLFGQNKKGKKITATKTILNQSYTTRSIKLYKLSKRPRILTLTLGVQPNSIISLKDAKTAKTLYRVNTPKKVRSDFYTLKVPISKLKGHKSLILIQKSVNKKASYAVTLPSVKNNVSISY